MCWYVTSILLRIKSNTNSFGLHLYLLVPLLPRPPISITQSRDSESTCDHTACCIRPQSDRTAVAWASRCGNRMGFKEGKNLSGHCVSTSVGKLLFFTSILKKTRSKWVDKCRIRYDSFRPLWANNHALLTQQIEQNTKFAYNETILLWRQLKTVFVVSHQSHQIALDNWISANSQMHTYMYVCINMNVVVCKLKNSYWWSRQKAN